MIHGPYNIKLILFVFCFLILDYPSSLQTFRKIHFVFIYFEIVDNETKLYYYKIKICEYHRTLIAYSYMCTY
jgi:hypothetical protein